MNAVGEIYKHQRERLKGAPGGPKDILNVEII